MTPESRLLELGLELPRLPAPGGNYVPFVRVGNLLHLAGTICVRDGQVTHAGPVGDGQTIETAREGARVCALNLIAMIREATGSLEAVKRFVMVNGYVQAVAGFSDSPAVINGASDLFVAIFGDAGRHARAAIAVAGLPRNSTVEVTAVVELH